MIALGLGFRSQADETALLAAFEAAVSNRCQPDALATVASKASAPALLALANRLQLPVLAIDEAQLCAQNTPTQSPFVRQRFNTGSVAEAAALAAAGPGAKLIVRRVVAASGMATAAIAESPS
ncbi:cobalamin biosynthesis protein [Aureimonas fodinaquatilis]|uniref:Cobalamin biosynthesis protein n=1 Tax=Aureimonas fodinaquatilis TaxID=2565783 RepID=A0A5B0DT14_9HYPH|nr:cobalamin biosynthesis protein [Aureimonas fodinaquatilis]KAA0969543.1 cobalamin biosynthesis protein [Aureimonas fodinaquatilis]